MPYQEEANCPTDEELIYAWGQHECQCCLTWWAERVRIDGRYSAIVEKVQNKWPRVAVWHLQNEAILDIRKRPAGCYDAIGYFYNVLWCKAHLASGSKKKIKEIQAEGSMELAEILEVPSIDPRLDYLIDCLALLPEKERELTEAIYYDRTPIVKLVKNLHQSRDTLYKKISRIRAKLRQCIDSKA